MTDTKSLVLLKRHRCACEKGGDQGKHKGNGSAGEQNSIPLNEYVGHFGATSGIPLYVELGFSGEMLGKTLHATATKILCDGAALTVAFLEAVTAQLKLDLTWQGGLSSDFGVPRAPQLTLKEGAFVRSAVNDDDGARHGNGQGGGGEEQREHVDGLAGDGAVVIGAHAPQEHGEQQQERGGQDGEKGDVGDDE